MACRRWFASQELRAGWPARIWSTCALSRHCRGSLKSCKGWIGSAAKVLFAGLSGYLLGTCLLKLVLSCVRVSNHVLSCSVALLAPAAAGRGAGADLVRFCRLQRRHVVASVPGPICRQGPVFQSV